MPNSYRQLLRVRLRRLTAAACAAALAVGACAAQAQGSATAAIQHLATAYGRKGNIGMAELASAQAFFNSGDLKNAQTQASRAMQKLPQGSPGYLRAEHILNDRPLGSYRS